MHLTNVVHTSWYDASLVKLLSIIYSSSVLLCVTSWFFLSAAMGASTNSVDLAWDMPVNQNTTNINVYWGVVTDTYTNHVAVGAVTNCTLSNLVSGVTYYLAATAQVDNGAESGFSNEAIFTVPALPSAVPPSIHKLFTLQIMTRTNNKAPWFDAGLPKFQVPVTATNHLFEVIVTQTTQ